MPETCLLRMLKCLLRKVRALQVHKRNCRWDVKLPMEGPALAALKESLHWLRPLLVEAVGEEARLCEWSALVSDPGKIAPTSFVMEVATLTYRLLVVCSDRN